MLATTKTELLRSSSGPMVTAGDFVLVHYQGHIVDRKGGNTVQFDANYNFGTFSAVAGRPPFEFQLGAGSVIQGWEKGILNRRIGEVIELTIPPSEGYGDRARDRIPPNSTLRFRVEIIGGFTPETFAPGLDPDFRHLSLSDFAINPRRIGLTAKDLLSVSSSAVGLDGSDVLTGKDAVEGVSAGRAKRDLLIGLDGNDLITGGAGGDLLIGGRGQDTFKYADFQSSRLSEIDRIYDLEIGKDRIDGVNAVNAAKVKELRRARSLDEAGIQDLLGAEGSVIGRRNFSANQAATFSIMSGNLTRTFLAINNEVAGYNANDDTLIEITGFRGGLRNLAII